MRLFVEIRGPAGERERRVLGAEAVVGRDPGCDLVLGRTAVSKRHLRLTVDRGGVLATDLGSTNGTRLNGAPLGRERRAVGPADVLEVGAYRLAVRAVGEDEAGGVAPVDRGPRAPAMDGAAGPASPPDDRLPTPPVPSREPPANDERRAAEAALRALVRSRLIEALDLRRLDLDRLGDDGLRRRAEAALVELLGRMEAAGELPGSVDRAALRRDVLQEALGLGPLDDLLADESVTEVMVNGADRIWVEREGSLTRTDRRFSSDAAVLAVIERIVSPVGRRIDEAQPLVDARLPDGSRVNAIIPPLSLRGPSITIRKFRRDRLTAAELVAGGSLSPAMAEFLRTCVRHRRNLVVSGGTGSGKTTLLNVLAAFIPPGERIVTLEDAAELQLPQEHWLPLEARPPNLEGRGAVTIRDLLKNALRMRPDRIVVGECRSGEALDMLQAMNTGHDGSLTTLHANTPRDALARIETLALMSGMELPSRAIREQIAAAVDVVVQVTRFADGSRRVTSIAEVTGLEGDTFTLAELFRFRQEGVVDGRTRGRFEPLGVLPRFYEELRGQGLALDLAPFRREEEAP